ncbi:MAG: tRNA (adenosine(37)-N6)-threonylcarbamoyltransferase complex ATPase subunit type 1 TsaE [Gemmatimonadetes bacterium]|nr:tRNA (adenosine(37)-N6)-threonylcarbamoyltransferase complex ATPase subunit type 1 TsaE [Gemmatimonadota bacterium]
MILDEAGLVRWGERIGRETSRPLFLALRGELGAGKSVLARAIARGAGVRAPMPSPTFNLLYRYDADRGRVFHIDLYRLDSPDEVWQLGWRELGEAGDIVLVEWPERVESLLPEPRWDVRLVAAEPGSLVRHVRIEPHGRPPPLPAGDASR